MAKIDEASPSRSWLSWEYLKRGAIGLAALFVVVVIANHVWRECRFAGIVLESVVVKGPAGESAATVEMVGQQIATYIDKIQRTGAREWRPHDLDEGHREPVNIQIPGSSLTVESVAREIASLFPHRRQSLRISVTSNPLRPGVTAAVAITDGGATTRAICDSDGNPGSLGKMFECLALESMKVINPLFAASYVLAAEEKDCSTFQFEAEPKADKVAENKRMLEDLRRLCGFKRTRAMASAVMERGKPIDQPWVSYIYGKLHLARAEALAKVDAEAEWYEFDRAIGRFRDLSHAEVPASALAIQMEAYIRNGLSIHESVLALNWPESKDLVKYRLKEAREILDDAAKILAKLADSRRKAAVPGAAQARTVEDGRTDAMISHLHGRIVYRQWMVDTHKRHRKGAIGFVEGDDERKRLQHAVELFDTASRQAPPTAALLVDWGTALRALREFDEAVKKYRQAGDIAPGDSTPLLKMAVALLEKSRSAAKGATIEDHFDAVRHVSSYLTWTGDGKPYAKRIDNLVDALEGVLTQAGGDAKRDFESCRQEFAASERPGNTTDLARAAELKICVDRARSNLAGRVVVNR
jgi:tetratricopeptide (TPR) repeat protein